MKNYDFACCFECMWKVVSNSLRVFRNRVLRKCVGLRGSKYRRLEEIEI
jgi:hypothetical protein